MLQEPILLDHPTIAYLLQPDDRLCGDTAVMEASRPITIADEDIPPEWTDVWSYYLELDRWQGFPGDKAWLLEHKWNILGQPELLLYNELAILFRAGGLYYLWGENYLNIFVFQANVTLPDILEALREDREGDLLISTRPLDHNYCAELMSDNYTVGLILESEQGRDRGKEQSDRGGYPPVSLFKKTKKSMWAINTAAGDNKTGMSHKDSTDDESSVEESGEDEGQSQDEEESSREEDLHLSNDEDASLGADSKGSRDGGRSQGSQEAEKSKDDEHTSESHDDGLAEKHNVVTGSADQSQEEDESGPEETFHPGKGKDESLTADSTSGMGGDGSQKAELLKDDEHTSPVAKMHQGNATGPRVALGDSVDSDG